MAAGIDPVLVGFVAVMLLLVFGIYLFVRRTLLGFREGYDRGKR